MMTVSATILPNLKKTNFVSACKEIECSALRQKSKEEKAITLLTVSRV